MPHSSFQWSFNIIHHRLVTVTTIGVFTHREQAAYQQTNFIQLNFIFIIPWTGQQLPCLLHTSLHTVLHTLLHTVLSSVITNNNWISITVARDDVGERDDYSSHRESHNWFRMTPRTINYTWMVAWNRRSNRILNCITCSLYNRIILDPVYSRNII